MGLYDSVYIDCPDCGAGRAAEFQSKSGPCELYEWSPDEAPIAVLDDIDRQSRDCMYCGTRLQFRAILTASTYVRVLGGRSRPKVGP